MKMNKIYFILLAIFMIAVYACKEDANEWDVDMSYNRLFSSTTFELDTSNPTAVRISYTGVYDASIYRFEFSEGDSLLFDNIVRTVDILADTLTTTSTATAVTSRTYYTWFEDLLGLTRYSVRMKAISEDGTESSYVSFCFDTPEEQIFTDVVSGLKKVTVYWESDKEVTHLLCGEIQLTKDDSGAVLQRDTVWLPQVDLTEAQKQEGSAVISDLSSGSSYVVSIYNDTNKRGTKTFSTLGRTVSDTSVMVELETSDDVSNKLADAVADGATDVMLVFKGGETYEAGTITIPDGIASLYFIGDIDAEGDLPVIHATSISISAPFTTLSLQYVDIDNELKTSYFIDINSANAFSRFSAEGCTLRNIKRCFIYLRNSDVSIEYVKFSNCTIQNMSSSGYGFLNFNKGAVGDLTFEHCTIMEIGDQLTDIRIALNNISMNRCLFCNYNIGIAKIWRIDKQPSAMTVTNSIFTGDNSGSTVNAGYSNYTYFDYLGCYLTSDFVEGSNAFTNATTLEMTSEELFVDPRNGDFHINPGVSFPGDGIAGPSKWWTTE